MNNTVVGELGKMPTDTGSSTFDSATFEFLVGIIFILRIIFGEPSNYSLGSREILASPTSHCRTAAPLPAAAAVMSLNLSPPALPCSSDISGDEGELLDEDPPLPAVISQPGGPNTSPTLAPHVVLAAVPSLINMEISESVKRDCSSSSIGKGIVTMDIHEFDDILIQAEGLHQQIIVICNVVFMAKILNDTFILLVLKEVQGEWRFSTIGVCATHAFDPGGYASQRFDGNSKHVGDGQAFNIKKPKSPKPDSHILITLPLRRGIEDQVEIMNEGVSTTLRGRRSVLFTISDFSIESSFGWTDENGVPSTWDPGPLVDSSCSLPVVENNLDGEVTHKSFVTSIADCYPAVRNPISREHYENLEHLDGRDGLKWLQLGIAPHQFLITILLPLVAVL